ncbi:MAG TPA: SIMPL domain-containing protein [Candidatus Paceibacterota bacterium]|jgi:uncharacterized protein YggE|nr:SIMPL domain-containing protein [Candidatus Paceibacterota bacterium]
MNTLFNDKKINGAVLGLLIVISLFTLAKFVNEIKASDYIGRGNQPANTISVQGTGDVMAVSDIATLNINLSKDGTTTKEAQDLLNQSIAKTLTYLKSQKIDDKDIKSEYGGLSPKYSYSQIVCMAYPCPTQNPKIIGYTATQSITVKIRAVDSASDVRTGLANIGVTDISGPTFSIDNQDSLNDQARAKAITDAKNKAEVLANELGVKLGKVVTFSENGNSPYPVIYEAKSMMASGSAPAAVPAPVLPTGENKITSNVSITYEIR